MGDKARQCHSTGGATKRVHHLVARKSVVFDVATALRSVLPSCECGSGKSGRNELLVFPSEVVGAILLSGGSPGFEPIGPFLDTVKGFPPSGDHREPLSIWLGRM